MDAELDIDWNKGRTPETLSDCALRGFDFRAPDLLGPDGSFEIRDVPPEHYVLMLTGETITKTRVDNLRTDLGVIEATTGRVISGRLAHRTHEKPVYSPEYNVRIKADRGAGRPLYFRCHQIDHNGRFTITHLPADVNSLTIIASKLGKDQPNAHPINLFDAIHAIDPSKNIKTNLDDIFLRRYRLQKRLIHNFTGEPLDPETIRDIQIEASNGQLFKIIFSGVI